MVKVKICGIKNLNDALTAAQAGADALGFVFARSKRQVTPAQAQAIIAALPPFVHSVGVFLDEKAATVQEIADFAGLDFLQFQGDESPEYCTGFKQHVIKSFMIKDQNSLFIIKAYKVAAYLLDSHVPNQKGGTGRTFDWELVRRFKAERPVILAGGLTPLNVAGAISVVGPYAVDVSSGVENETGEKDPQKIKAFIQQAKSFYVTY